MNIPQKYLNLVRQYNRVKADGQHRRASSLLDEMEEEESKIRKERGFSGFNDLQLQLKLEGYQLY